MRFTRKLKGNPTAVPLTWAAGSSSTLSYHNARGCIFLKDIPTCAEEEEEEEVTTGQKSKSCAADINAYCDYWIGVGYACNNPWTKANCKTTCCGKETCGADNNYYCSYWTANGYPCRSAWAADNCQ